MPCHAMSCLPCCRRKRGRPVVLPNKSAEPSCCDGSVDLVRIEYPTTTRWRSSHMSVCLRVRPPVCLNTTRPHSLAHTSAVGVSTSDAVGSICSNGGIMIIGRKPQTLQRLEDAIPSRYRSTWLAVSRTPDSGERWREKPLN
jgi:hypothetical protein